VILLSEQVGSKIHAYENWQNIIVIHVQSTLSADCPRYWITKN